MGNKSKKLTPRQLEQQRLCAEFLQKIQTAKNKEERFELLQKIAGDPGVWTTEALFRCLEDPCEKIRDFLIDTLSRRDNLNPDHIQAKLQSSPWFVKSAILRIFGLQKDPKWTAAIETLLHEPNADVRRTAAQSLGDIGGKAALDLLLELAKDSNRFVQLSAEKALHKISDLKFS